MTELYNEILIKGSLKDIWNTLNRIEALEQYDPTVKNSAATSDKRSGLGASRKVEMVDGKNWFEEKCTVSDPNKTLKFELTACSFPVHALNHSYSFEEIGEYVKVKQVMQYQMKFGLVGKLMDILMVKRQSNKGVRSFLAGLKKHIEQIHDAINI